MRKYWKSGTFLTEALTREALQALDKAKAYNQPFYLYMSHYAVHIPIDKDVRFFDKYKKKGLSDKEAAYAALIEGMDKSLGDIMDWLENNGEADNTIIIFMGDNGGYATGAHWRDAPLYTQNYPLKCGKGSAYEGGVREPMIVYWPGVTEGGTRCGSYIMAEDIYPSILEMAGIKRYSVPQTVDGKSFVPLLDGSGDPSSGRDLFWNFPNLWGETGPGIGSTCTVRSGDWKLIYFYETGTKELYNIADDIGEGPVYIRRSDAEEALEVYKEDSTARMSAWRKDLDQLESYVKAGIPMENIALAYVVSDIMKDSDRALYDTLHQMGIPCMVSTSPRQDREESPQKRLQLFREVLASGPDIIETDFPVEFLRILE